MRLYLSSYRMGERAGALLALLGNGKRAALIENGLDGCSASARAIFRADCYDPVADLAALGIAATPLDLRHYFGQPAALRQALLRYDLVWVADGNSFVLRRAMRQSGFDDVIVDLLEADALVYGGVAAGAVVAAPSLRGFELMDDPDEVPAGYDPGPVWDGLGLVDLRIVPHYRSRHPDSAAADNIVRYLAGRGLRYRALRDSEVIVWTEDRRRTTSSGLLMGRIA